MKKKGDLLTELLEQLEALPLTDNYTKQDQYNDFRQLFLGSEQGKRVYREIVAWGGLMSNPIRGDSIDRNKLLFAQGQRDIVVKLISAINIEPKEKPTKATKLTRAIRTTQQ